MKNSGLPKPPAHLSKEARQWWTKIVDLYEIDEPGLLLLRTAMESLDRLREAQDMIREEGIVVKDRFNQSRQHPATLVERDAKNMLLRSIKARNLDIEIIGRPPAGRR